MLHSPKGMSGSLLGGVLQTLPYDHNDPWSARNNTTVNSINF